MALLELGEPPVLIPRSHTDYAPWLQHRCYDTACAYCAEVAQGKQVDHVVPVSHDDGGKLDPKNLLPACDTCNGAGGKWDYHPLNSNRRKLRADTTGFLPLDPRVDDYALLYEIDPDGTLQPLAGGKHDRAKWNRDVLFRLNRRKLVRWRHQSMQLIEAAERLVVAVTEASESERSDVMQNRDTIITEVARRLLLVELFDVHLSRALRELAEAERSRARAALS